MTRRLKLTRPLAIVDLETTGTTVTLDRIVEIAIAKIQPDGSKSTYHKRINPGVPIPPEATKVHGIGDSDVRSCPQFKKLAAEIGKVLSNCDLAGYNLVKFDLPLLQNEFARAKVDLSWDNCRVVDVCQIFHRKERRDLGAALKFFCDEEHSGAHSALNDVEACWKVLKAQLIHYSDLPLDVQGLHKYCDPPDSRYVDGGRKFEWRFNQAHFAFGKHRGHSLHEVAEEDSEFLEWMLGADFPPDTREIVARALKGKFPRPPLRSD
jgi:DNA polymerase III subunit epsilon